MYFQVNNVNNVPMSYEENSTHFIDIFPSVFSLMYVGKFHFLTPFAYLFSQFEKLIYMYVIIYKQL